MKYYPEYEAKPVRVKAVKWEGKKSIKRLCDTFGWERKLFDKGTIDATWQFSLNGDQIARLNPNDDMFLTINEYGHKYLVLSGKWIVASCDDGEYIVLSDEDFTRIFKGVRK